MIPLLLLIAQLQPLNISWAAPSPNARPKEFTKKSAMLAIFDEYNDEHSATLLPTQKGLTQVWNLKDAELVAEPILAEVTKNPAQGVLVVSRHPDSNQCGHPDLTTISIYLFELKDGLWTFKRGKKEVTQASLGGACAPPEAKVIPIGRSQMGLKLLSSYSAQGITVSTLMLFALEDPEFKTSVSFRLQDEKADSETFAVVLKESLPEYSILHRKKCYVRAQNSYVISKDPRDCSGQTIASYEK